MADNVAITQGSGKTVLADEVTDATLGTGVAQLVKLMDGTIDGTTKSAIVALSDALSNPNGLMVGSCALFWNPANATWERGRTPTVTKAVNTNTPSSGDTAIWTPASGKKFRLMAALITISGSASRAAGSATQFQLRDSTTSILGFQAYIPASAGTTIGSDISSGWMTLPGNGWLSAAANNVLNLNLGATLSTGSVFVTAVGTEE